MEIRFSMTSRLIVLALTCSLLLLVLMFALGFVTGQRLKTAAEPTPAGAKAGPGVAPAAALPAASGAASVAR